MKIFLIITFLCAATARGQQVQSFLQPSLQNPAAMGRSKNINIGLFAQHDMAGFEGSRTTVACAGDFPLVYNRTYRELYKKYMFLGFSFQNENYSIYNNFSAMINYAYRLQVAKEHYLRRSIISRLELLRAFLINLKIMHVCCQTAQAILPY